jgi:hypothetical protein
MKEVTKAHQGVSLKVIPSCDFVLNLCDFVVKYKMICNVHWYDPDQSK